MNKNVEKGKRSEASVMKFLSEKGASKLADIGRACGPKKTKHSAWAWSVCRRLVAQGMIARQVKGKTVLYDLLVRNEKQLAES